MTNAVLFLITAAIALMTGLYTPRLLTGTVLMTGPYTPRMLTDINFGLSIGLMIIMYSFVCIAFAYLMLFHSMKEGGE
jgi:hypothetical protein